MAGPVHVRGAGLMTCLGEGLAAQVPALRGGRPGPHAVPPGFRIPPWPYHRVPGYEGPDRLLRILDAAVEQALAQAALPAAARERMALLVGSTCLDLPLHESAYADHAARGAAEGSIAQQDLVPIHGPSYGNVAAHVAQRYGIRGPQYTLNTACSSSANALLHARLLLSDGRAEHALVLGLEAYNRLSVQGFGALLLLSKQGYRPFDRDRDGLILGEGAGAIVLGRGPAPPGGLTLRGAASACDPSSPTNSLPGRMAEVMLAALDDAGLAPRDLVAIKAHGTGTASNDASEGQAMQQLGPGLPPFTSLKPYIGHTLGGCGVLETLLLLAAWEAGFLPPTPGFAALDPAIGAAPMSAARPLPAQGAVLCNYFGFGGNNTSLVFERTADGGRP